MNVRVNLPPDDLLVNLVLRLIPTGEARTTPVAFLDGSAITVEDNADGLPVAPDSVGRTRRYRLSFAVQPGEGAEISVPSGCGAGDRALTVVPRAAD